ncbi:MAG TPA: hypothetical protein VGO00_03690, partial [Kofleriaceae bacterium]|nr:hypothetical protein [Kofleriaceae bacterium]
VLARTSTTLAALQRSPAVMHELKPRELEYLLGTQCDGLHTAAHDVLAHELTDPTIHFEDIWRTCVELQQRLAPAFAKLIGP